jgi:hypothetical protein
MEISKKESESELTNTSKDLSKTSDISVIMAPVSNVLYIAQVVALYWIVSISMVYLNKVMLSNYDSTIPAPIFVTWFQVCYIIYIFTQANV